MLTGHVRQRGFTLIEMMISLTIGLVILAGLVKVLTTSSSSSRSNDLTSELIGNGRFALSTLKTEARQAGFRGYTWAEPSEPLALGTLTNECLEGGAAAGTFLGNIRQGIWGANNSNPFANNCISTSDYLAGNDVLVIRRLGSNVETSLTANRLYFQSAYEVGQVFRGTTAPVFAGSPSPLGTFALQTFVYYISPYTVSADESPLIPALYRVALQSDGSMSSELVASGIEHMQVQYGRVTTAPSIQYLDTLSGSSSNAIYPPTPTEWDDINSVQIWLLARNSTEEPGYVNNNTYIMAGQSFVKADSFRRQLFTTTVQLRN